AFLLPFSRLFGESGWRKICKLEYRTDQQMNMDNWHRDDAVHEYVDENGNICYGTYEEAREHLEREQEELARRLAGELDDDNDYYEDEEAEEEPLEVSPHAQELADLLSTVLMGNVELQDALETSLREAKRNPD